MRNACRCQDKQRKYFVIFLEGDGKGSQVYNGGLCKHIALRAVPLRRRRQSMTNQEHEPDTARRILNLLYVIRVTEKLGEKTLPAAFVAGYNHALDDLMDAIKCEFDILDLEWMWDA
jgi:hypothetical protein